MKSVFICYYYDVEGHDTDTDKQLVKEMGAVLGGTGGLVSSQISTNKHIWGGANTPAALT